MQPNFAFLNEKAYIKAMIEETINGNPNKIERLK